MPKPITKTERIRREIQKHPKLSNSQLAGRMGGGILAQDVAVTRYAMKKAAAKAALVQAALVREAPAAPAVIDRIPASRSLSPDTELQTIAEFVRACGGFEGARAALNELEALQVD